MLVHFAPCREPLFTSNLNNAAVGELQEFRNKSRDPPCELKVFIALPDQAGGAPGLCRHAWVWRDAERWHVLTSSNNSLWMTPLAPSYLFGTAQWPTPHCGRLPDSTVSKTERMCSSLGALTAPHSLDRWKWRIWIRKPEWKPECRVSFAVVFQTEKTFLSWRIWCFLQEAEISCFFSSDLVEKLLFLYTDLPIYFNLLWFSV